MKRVKKILLSKSFIGSILFALALWSYSSLNSEFTTYVEIPLKVLLPPNRAIEEPLPATISAEVRGSGWHLFNLLYFNTSKICDIDLTKVSINKDLYSITRVEIIKNIQHLGNLEIRDVQPDNMNIITGAVGVYRVAVIPVVNIQCLEGFTVVGSVRCQPDSIRLTGNDKIVRGISRWLTQNSEFYNVHKSFSAMVPLSDSLSDRGVFTSQSQVAIKAEVQQIAELTFDDIPVKIRGGAAPQSHLLSPMILRVTVRAGAEQLETLTAEEIVASIDYSRLLNDSTGIVIPEVSVPDGYKLLSFEPKYIYHFVNKNQNTLSRQF